ncbi:TIR domain-containing protein [Zymobacter palmae]|uniref:Uncharacterized protein conserved in bacteria n=1 Tax=Zymobacter palmae TaxID=33074 RepID=A0A348HER7_9GAMM|nr:toll/interleukin-1 receptor domain-containing protein [Zymobacter palmae]BBG30119.1 uncharacterized protein conserved in bacteria [Zymobacter palmae]
MYVGFEIEHYQPIHQPHDFSIHSYIQDAKMRVDNLAQFFIGSYNQCSVLDAEALSAKIFPETKYDVFLSHSHADQRNAIDLALALSELGLNVFVDSTVWGYFGDLVAQIIAKTRPLDKETKDSHTHRVYADVHMMLASALHRTIAQAETFVFVRSEKSVPVSFGDRDRTFSPWIYSELQFSFQVQHTMPNRIRERLTGATLDSVKGFNNLGLESMQHLMAFRAFNDHLPPVQGAQLREWLVQQPSTNRGETVLDALYSRFNLPSKYQQQRASLTM